MATKIAQLNIDLDTKRALVDVAGDLAGLNQVPAAVVTDITAMYADMVKVRDRQKTQIFNSAGLVIAAGKKTANIANTIYGVANGVLFKKTTADCSALVGTVTNTNFNIFVFSIDSSGVVTTATGTQGSTLGAVVWPTIVASKAILGFVIVNPTGTGNFVGGTTDLDDATVAPNAVYVNVTGSFDAKTALSTQTSTPPSSYVPVTTAS